MDEGGGGTGEGGEGGGSDGGGGVARGDTRTSTLFAISASLSVSTWDGGGRGAEK